MSMTDPVADLLTRIRNAQRAGLEELDLPASKLKQKVAEVLRDEGFVREVTYAKGDGPQANPYGKGYAAYAPAELPLKFKQASDAGTLLTAKDWNVVAKPLAGAGAECAIDQKDRDKATSRAKMVRADRARGRSAS